MPIGSDFTIDTVNKRIYHSANNNVYTVNDLYSWLMNEFDELAYMDDEIPMTAQTPTEYTMVNGWFIDDDSAKYLSGGAIETNGYNGQIQIVTLVAGGYTNCVSGDIGKNVTEDTNPVGNLLFYNNTTRKWWIRGTVLVGATSVMAIPTGTGAGTSVGSVAVTGEDLYANIYTLGTLASTPNPQAYVFQGGTRIAEWSDKTNWDRGQIDVLIKVREAEVETAGGLITVFARQYGDSYDHFGIDIGNGGRNAVPFATAIDSNNTIPSHYLLYDGSDTGSFTAGDIVSGATSFARAEVLTVTEFTDTTKGIIGLGDVVGTFQDNENLMVSAVVEGLANGVLGDSYLAYDGETAPFTVGAILTASGGGKRKIKGLYDAGATGYLTLLADVEFYTTGGTVYYTNILDNETLVDDNGAPAAAVALGDLNRGIAGFKDIGIFFVNGTITYGSQDVNFTKYEKLTQDVSGATGFVLKDVDAGATGTLTLGNVTGTWDATNEIDGSTGGNNMAISTSTLTKVATLDQAFFLGTDEPYNVVVVCRNHTLSQVYEYMKYVCGEGSVYNVFPMFLSGTLQIEQLDGEEYLIAYRDDDTPANSYPPVKASPFGTFAGGKLFGAKGVWIEGMASADNQNYQLLDAEGDTMNPPNKQLIRITNLLSGDTVGVFKDDGTGEVDKDMFLSHATSNDTSTVTYTLAAASSIPNDTPATGFLRMVNVGTGVEERIAYTAWDGTAKTFTLSSAHAGGYAGDDYAYAPYIDIETATTAEEVELVYTASRAIIIRVRRYAAQAIQPFQTTGTFSTTGYSIAAIRVDDNIVSGA